MEAFTIRDLRERTGELIPDAEASKLVAVTFEGVLHVSAPTQMTELLNNGIGHAQAFGCGLLLVRRV